MQTKKKQQLAERKKLATRQLIGIEGITEYSLKTGLNPELVFFLSSRAISRCCPKKPSERKYML